MLRRTPHLRFTFPQGPKAPSHNGSNKPRSPFLSTLANRNTLRYSYYILLFGATISSIHISLYDFVTVTGPSMSPTLSPTYHATGSKDSVLVSRRARSSPAPPSSFSQTSNFPDKPLPPFLSHAREDVRRGDVVTFIKPHKPSEGESVKRVLGVEGDIVWRDVRRVGREREQDGKQARDIGLLPLPPVVKVPLGHVWVEGDNWRDSLDSNDFGPISLSLITGRVDRIYWPLKRWGKVPERVVTKESARTRIVPDAVFLPPGFERYNHF
ncbi:LexA/Signal peptidase [Tothia fuscella]|uniref:Mitochondrial inner membrane protease subunit n=1 Tax=Tothia fuscella TaxID=1048955 RepID=A0A9P4TTH3_9PEZI|nr:LexA/Signal peptidase [Tothia fuscella]